MLPSSSSVRTIGEKAELRAPRKIGILPPTCCYEKAAMEAAGRRKD